MKPVFMGLLLALQAAAAPAATMVLDPGPGTDYLAQSCGGQTVNEIGAGFDANGNAMTLVKVSTTCHGSGHSSPNQYYLACWTVGFDRGGAIASKLWLATNHWQQGNPAIPCPVAPDPSAVYTSTDGAGNFPATESTTLVGTSSQTYRAVLETSCGALKYGDSANGTLAPASQACYSFGGDAGNGVRVSAQRNSGTLNPAEDLRRPDGSTLCASATPSLECSLDASGLHTLVLRDATGTGSGDYTLILLRSDIAHLTVGMSGTLSVGRQLRTLSYQVSVGNDGGAAASGVVLTDTLPQGLSYRKATSSLGSCTHAQRAITCTLGSLAAHSQAQVTIEAVTAMSSGQVSNSACVEAGTCATVVTDLH